MALLCQLLLRIWVTDHGDCHFRAEESLEKVTVVTSKRREDLHGSKSSKSSRFTELTEWVGRRAGAARARGITAHIL
jgi:hypothetical protein